KLKQNVRKKTDYSKKNFEDFVLWKKTTKGIQYISPWFKGRPGWHTECVVMIKKLFLNTIDIHGGGIDLKFPHHENEQAQFWAGENKPLTQFFMHVGHVYYQNAKMSKSLGNIVLTKDILINIEPNAIKLFFLSCNYLQPMNYSYELLQTFQLKYKQIIYHLNKNNFQLVLHQINNSQIIDTYIDKLHLIMSDNLNTPNILTLVEEVLKKIHQKHDVLNELAQLQNTLIYLLKHLDIQIVLKKVTTENIQTYYAWKKAQKQKDFQKSDTLRIILQNEKII
ncbi:Cysteinyl-tRNA synthetase, partial [Candidatus Phytoplasma phoenicium]